MDDARSSPSVEAPPPPGEQNGEVPLSGLRGIVARHIRHWPKDPVRTGRPVLAPPTISPATQFLVRLIPWALGLTFCVSFFWDFDRLAVQFAGESLHFLADGDIAATLSIGWLPLPRTSGTLPLDGLLLVLSCSGLIGFFTNWLAIGMLFRPRDRHPIFGQGVIPAQRDGIIVRLATAIDRELIGPDVIKKGIRDSGVVPKFLVQAEQALRGLLEDEEFRAEIRAVIHAYVEGALSSEELRKEIADFTFKKLEENFDKGVGGMAVKAMLQFAEGPLRSAVDRAIREMPQGLGLVLQKLDMMLDALPDKLSARSDAIEDWATGAAQSFVGNLDVYSMLVSRMQSFDEHGLEDLIKYSSNDQLNYIKYLGGVLGFIGGLVIFNRWLALPALAALVLILVGIDFLIIKVSRQRERRLDAAAR